MRVGVPVRLHPEPYHGARSLCCQGRAGGRAEAIHDAEGIWAAPQILEDREGKKRVRLIGRYLAWFRAPDGWQGVTTFDHGADRDSEAWALDFLDRQRAGIPLYRNGG